MQVDSGVRVALPVLQHLAWLLVRRLRVDSQPRTHLQGRRLALQVRDWARCSLLWSCLDYSELCCPCEQSLMRIPPFFWTIEG
jgi:hypothetical protein